MSIQIDREQQEKQYIFRDGDTEIYYRAVPKRVRDSIQRKHTKRGICDFIACADDGLQYAVTGWKGVRDKATDAEIPFSKELISSLPLSAQNDIYENAVEVPADAEERQLGN